MMLVNQLSLISNLVSYLPAPVNTKNYNNNLVSTLVHNKLSNPMLKLNQVK